MTSYLNARFSGRTAKAARHGVLSSTAHAKSRTPLPQMARSMAGSSVQWPTRRHEHACHPSAYLYIAVMRAVVRFCREPRGSALPRLRGDARQGIGSQNLPWPVDIRPVLDGQDSDLPDGGVDTVDHPVIAARSAVEPAEAEPERLAGPMRIRSEGAVQELRY